MRVSLNGFLTFFGEITELGEGCRIVGCKLKIAEPGRDMFEISIKALPEPQESIGSERLHEALCRSFPKGGLEGGPIKTPLSELVTEGEQFITFGPGEIDIRIAEEGAKIVKRAPEAHSLEVNEERFSVTDHHILGLQIPVNQTALCSQKSLCQVGKLRFEFSLGRWSTFDLADTSDKMISKIISFPTVEIEAKVLHEPYTPQRKVLFWKGMKSLNDDQRLLIKNASGFGGFFAERPEVRISEVLHKNETAGRIVADQTGNGYIDVTEKYRNVGVVSIFNALRVIMDQDGRIFTIPFQPEKSPIGSSPLEEGKL